MNRFLRPRFEPFSVPHVLIMIKKLSVSVFTAPIQIIKRLNYNKNQTL
ncbi:hypothetical protein SJDPG4_03740 [Porphyromonas gingivalis SJD4]|nr:hypothetical protein SJDPG4_03740 [Porphyromonas gingivalis SJD4]